MSAFSDLRKKLAELFQLDAAAELDFGIYRILNARRVEIEGFLDSLEPQVEAILAEALQTGTGELIAELEKVEAGLRAGGFDDAMISTAPKVKELRDKIASAGGDPTAITHETFSLLTTFFGRYYKDGDFLSLRRYKKDTYAIPYEGEEVKLHWANADQYYIKSAETYRDYSFKLGPAPKDDKPDTRPTVTFKLTEADAEKDNNKAVAGQERRFVYQGLHQDSSLPENSKLKTENLILSFSHLPIGKAEKQTALNEAAAATILAEHAKGPFTGLAANDPTYTGKQKGGRSILAKHLGEYTGKNSFDYFIHKDLGGFLRRELDFFIKNEVVHLDDLDDAPESNWKETRAKIKALRTISGKVIRFLAQIENFQKKLWLKKKFVVETNYGITLDRIPEEFYPEIAACDAQREEWVKLFAINEIKTKASSDLLQSAAVGYSSPLSVGFLKSQSHLVLDTSNFSRGFKARVIQVITNFDEQCNGLLVHAENFQGLVSSRALVSKSVKCAYIDPPYNTGSDGFPYKDSHAHSSWATMMENRLVEIFQHLSPYGHLFASIDENEVSRLVELLKRVAGDSNYLGELMGKFFFPLNC
jgi:adenine-specific DNA-methyltransferase